MLMWCLVLNCIISSNRLVSERPACASGVQAGSSAGCCAESERGLALAVSSRAGAQGVQVTGKSGEAVGKRRATRRPRKPERPDGVIEEGYDGMPLFEDHQEVEVHVQPGNLWRHKPKVQIAHVKRALSAISRAMWRWNEVAATLYVPGQRSEADSILGDLWKRRELRLKQLKWLRSEIPVDPVTGLDVKGEEEDHDDV
jgi:hypothetical protein